MIAGLGLLLLAVGVLTWLAERRRNAEQFGGGPVRGIGSGFWYAAVTMTTVGDGDKAPTTLPGRLIGLVWMFTALLLVSTFTAAIASALTVGQLAGRVRSADDLAHVRVASLAGTTSAQWLERRGIGHRSMPDLGSALDAVARDGVDAVVYDAPLLHWTLVAGGHDGRLRVLPLVLERQDYAFPLPRGSALRAPLNEALLARINAPDWSERSARYLGEGS
ncbi:ion channel [Coralloluteibacterium thermophilus]|uniref:Ion channel n=1 Tax=Coralloluteibacterium thermophilum TaxID=2707049 RepID=A0ABV9NI75_9GAMM